MNDSGVLAPGRLFEVVAEVPRDVEGFGLAVFAEAGARGQARPGGGGLAELRCDNRECLAGTVRLETLPGRPDRKAPEPACPVCNHALTFVRRLRPVVLLPAPARRPGEGDGGQGGLGERSETMAKAKRVAGDDYYLNRLREICADLALQHGVFFLGRTETARRLDISDGEAEARLQWLIAHGELEVVQPGDRRKRTAARYRWRAPQGG
jgi:hypothetical protein